MKTEQLLIVAAAFGAGYLLANKGDGSVGANKQCHCWRAWPDGTYTSFSYPCGSRYQSLCAAPISQNPFSTANIFKQPQISYPTV